MLRKKQRPSWRQKREYLGKKCIYTGPNKHCWCQRWVSGFDTTPFLGPKGSILNERRRTKMQGKGWKWCWMESRCRSPAKHQQRQRSQNYGGGDHREFVRFERSVRHPILETCAAISCSLSCKFIICVCPTVPGFCLSILFECGFNRCCKSLPGGPLLDALDLRTPLERPSSPPVQFCLSR